MSLPRLAWIVTVMLWVAPGAVRGDVHGEPHVDVRGDALSEAKRIVKQANTQYQLGRFTEASDAYARSYELVPTPGLLFNLGQCQMALENYPRAIFFFEGYLRDKPDAPNAALVRDLLAEARKAVLAKAAKQRDDEAAALAARARPEPVPPPPPPPIPPPPRDRRRLPAIATGAASIALVGASVYLGMRSDLADSTSRLVAAGSPARSAIDGDRRRYAIAAGVTGSVALAAAISSGVLGYLGFRTTRAPSVAIAPTPNGAATVVSGSF